MYVYMCIGYIGSEKKKKWIVFGIISAQRTELISIFSFLFFNPHIVLYIHQGKKRCIIIIIF